MAVLRPLHYVFCCTLRPPSMAPGCYRYYFRGKCTLIDISILNPSYCTKLVHLKSRMPNFTCFRGIWQFSSLPTVCPHLQRFSLSLLAFYLRWDPGWGECWDPSPNFLDLGQSTHVLGPGGPRNLFVRTHLESLWNPQCLSVCPSVTEVLIISPAIRLY